jgi:hypothetical protein
VHTQSTKMSFRIAYKEKSRDKSRERRRTILTADKSSVTMAIGTMVDPPRPPFSLSKAGARTATKGKAKPMEQAARWSWSRHRQHKRKAH